MRSTCLLVVLLVVSWASTDAAGPSRPQDPAQPLSPNEVVYTALLDISNVPVEQRPYTRYLSLHNIPPQERPAFGQLLDFVLNSLSRRRTLAYATPVLSGALLRVDLDNYGWTPKAWDDLAEKGSGPVRVTTKRDQPEPYFQIRAKGKTRQKVKVQTQPYVADNGQTYDYRYEEQEVEATLAHGPWLDPRYITNLSLQAKTNHPVLRADWFIANATIAPAYNEILGFRSIRDFQEFVRYRPRDEDLAVKGIVCDSQEVSLHQRAALMTPTVLGRYWETFDYFTSVGEDDLLKDLVKKRRDAGEIFAEGPNGLQYFLLVDGKDNVIDVADGNVVADQNTPWKNKLVWAGMTSCTCCHIDGAKAINDEVRLTVQPPFALLVKDKKLFQQTVDLFSTPINDPIDQTKAAYARAVLTASRGLAPAKNSAALQAAFVGYIQKPMAINDIAAEVGTTPDEIRAVLGRAVNVDHTLTRLLKGRPIRRDHWEFAGYEQLATMLYQRKAKP